MSGVLNLSFKPLHPSHIIGLVTMIGDTRIWRAAFVTCFVVLAISVISLATSNYPVEGIPTPKLITDKEVYKWGETIHVQYIFVNDGNRAISFQPPGTLMGINGRFEGDLESAGASSVVHISYTSERITLSPGGVFTVLQRDFPQKRVGNFTVWCGSVSKTIEVLASDPNQIK